MLDTAANYIQQTLGLLAIISISICFGSQANGQSTTAELEKLMAKKMEVVNTSGNQDRKGSKENRKPAKAKRTPVKENRRPATTTPAATNSGKLKVPKFGVEAPKKTPIPTFGEPVETIEYSEEVKAKALEVLNRYDRDKNLFLDEVELASGRWNPSALTSDKNGDGRLSLAELHERYQQRNIERQKYREAYGRGDRSGEGRDTGSGRDAGNRMRGWRGRQSYNTWGSSNDQTSGRGEKGGGTSSDRSRSSSKSSGEARSKDSSSESSRYSGSRSGRSRMNGLRTSATGTRTSKSRSSGRVSSAFTKLDANSDRLVQMHEYSSTWPKKKLDEFLAKDTNGDGVISPEEW